MAGSAPLSPRSTPAECYQHLSACQWRDLPVFLFACRVCSVCLRAEVQESTGEWTRIQTSASLWHVLSVAQREYPDHFPPVDQIDTVLLTAP